jgi:hypothetical protein
MKRKQGVLTAAAVAVLAVAAVAVAKADNLLTFARPGAPDAKVYTSDHTPSQDRLLAKTAFTQILSRKAQFLGIAAPENEPSYAPVYPDGLILEATLSPTTPSGGSVQYAAAGSLRTLLDFYEDAAALNHMPFQVSSAGPDALVFKAADGVHKVQATLTRQFADSTEVDLSYQ